MKFFVIIFLVTKVGFARIEPTKQPDDLKIEAYYICAEQARIGLQLNPMISEEASDTDIAKKVFQLKTNDEDEHATSHCFYFCVFEHMTLISNPGAVLKPNKNTVAFDSPADRMSGIKAGYPDVFCILYIWKRISNKLPLTEYN
uniref:Uncharacterized protein n=1 Tax=Glossina pallidipes TaxID=7398 RepID=A0A1B0AER8_GLOPL